MFSPRFPRVRTTTWTLAFFGVAQRVRTCIRCLIGRACRAYSRPIRVCLCPASGFFARAAFQRRTLVVPAGRHILRVCCIRFARFVITGHSAGRSAPTTERRCSKNH